LAVWLACGRRTRPRITAKLIENYLTTLSVDVFAPDSGSCEAWIEIGLDQDVAPPAIVQKLADKRLHVREARPRGTGYHLIATA